ncbi:MAG: monovalent cation/H+ antiporter complex subunit F [Myxococcota bacterium]|nr:monovalent cation/H+ antiporter complex subunit F [Myxococcota bacterium]
MKAYLVVAIAGVLVTMAMALVRAARGPSVYDRILAVNSFGTVTVLFISVLGFLLGRPDFLDLALLYALLNFVGTIAILKYFKYGNLAAGED